MCDVIEAVAARVLDLPPYTLDGNPIENAFRTTKQCLRSAVHRLADAPWADMRRLLNTRTPATPPPASGTTDTRY